MRFFSTLSLLASLAAATILENGQVRKVNFLDTKVASIGSNSTGWKTYGPNATEISYKGRWDSKHISWWAAPGIKFGFTGDQVAISFGQYTSPGVLVAYRLSGQDWQFTNVTANSTHQFVSRSTPGLNATLPSQLPLSFELRVTNWAYGVQLSAVHIASSANLIKIPNHSKTIEFIGDSLTSGMYATYEAFSSFGYNIGAGFGNVEFSVTAYPGICLHDANCWGNPRGQTYQWHQTSDTSWRASQIYGESPEKWDFRKHPAADIVLINLGTNDNNTANSVSNTDYLNSYMKFVADVHEVYPKAQIILMSLWNGFYATGNLRAERSLQRRDLGGILQHNDIAPQWHPTDVGHIKIASHVMQYIRIKFGWEFGATGPEVQHETLYWNDESGY
ncbi:GDSL-like Lipase/Acylhydrolase-like protein [Zopfia rhizophila CBS 207.26]|uniref:GDSL-like Lipase/Acylhydrolase-like protein n=1 Tax=Zopfia rhizophila CBS 207.26 TaxID=1314779 RepID=A0A6A6EFF0_9PEZI|nr:GDSL-like Lipase/Acylhydrolase-like protein [Zopfia rhizophila CBS 207.26]